ncbi:phosphate transport system permease protein [Gracilibacillus halotolerans]|uniref:Phosphate transport system permease protein n=1 Tax=Gracilibacillus halotolerans TaxID=74386 RepID=A0A841RNV7_9BACI|nr:phosphate ABC transporter permease subunit PstC [Gracilibacillus halotolerans]MBB6513293.1 phosphate transport system permease protein [Gracilibacillus halotolerans]
MKFQKEKNNKSNIEEGIVKVILFIMALSSVISLGLITFFVFNEGLPFMINYGITDFIFGTTWNPTDQVYGIFPMIVGSVIVTVLAMLIGAPIGIAVAVYLVEIAPRRVAKIVKPAIQLLEGIPSVVIGLFGMVVIIDLLRRISRGPLSEYLPAGYQTGYSVLAGVLILAIMILPTIISISADSIRAVPQEYKEGSYAMGATKWQTIFRVVVPAAKSGILAAVILGVGRAIGETMAIIMVVGNSVQIPIPGWETLFAPVRTLTGNIALEMGYAGPEHRQALFATGIILFIFIIIINSLTLLLRRRRT